MKRIILPLLLVPCLFCLHYFAARAVYREDFDRKMNWLEYGDTDTFGDIAFNILNEILWFPCMQLSRIFNIYDDFTLLVLEVVNSLLWAVCLCGIGVLCNQKSRRVERTTK